MRGQRRAGRQGRALRFRLRIASVLGLAAGLLYGAIEGYYRPSSALPALLLGWIIHTTLASAGLVASYLPLTRRQIDRLVLALTLGHIANAHLYLVLSPHNPAIVASGLSFLLVLVAVFFSWSGRRVLIVSGLACVTFAVVGANIRDPEVQGAPFAVALGALVVGSGVAAASARVLGRLRARLARRQRDLAALSARLMSVQEEERRRLSRELHDEFGQSLSAVNAYLWLIERQPPADVEGLRARTTEARHLISRTLAAMRELSQLLRPSTLDEFGLLPSLDDHLKAFAQRHQIATSFNANGLPERLPPEMEIALYRITQEALTNVARHARAHRVRVALVVREGELRLEIDDDGIGFPARGNGARTGTGLVGIRERVRALHGTLTLHSANGAHLRVSLPLPG